MNDSRLRIASQLIGEARTLLVAIVDERPTDADLKDFNNIDAARQFLNGALPYIQAAETEQP
jgi:hypothetical protein